MYLIDCPWCGPREQTEFRCGGEGHIIRPGADDKFSDAAWADYLFMRKNPKGVHYDRWVHVHGCRRWFHLARNTATDEILATYGISESAPEVSSRTAPTPCGEPHIGSGNLPLAEEDGG
ncbi:MAG: sarcosine oxidase subunit delta [Alphaproteobacteria bacterium]